MEKIKNPELKMDTKVFVKDDSSHKWQARHFKKWCKKGIMVCHQGGTSSFTKGGGEGGRWRFWKVADGVYRGETNLQIGEYNE